MFLLGTFNLWLWLLTLHFGCCVRKVFRPPLPMTLNIQFEIVSTSWVTSVYILEPPAKGKKVDYSYAIAWIWTVYYLINRKIIILLTLFLVHFFVPRDDPVGQLGGMEIAETLQISKPSKKLETIMNSLHNLSQLCCDFREKLVVLSSVETDGQTEAVQSLN